VADSSAMAGRTAPPGIDTTIPQPARFWDYLLGGKDNYPIDREVGEQVLSIFPDLLDSARADRGFLLRVVRYLVKEAGIRQLLDIGTGLPTVNNTHQVAQTAAPECRIVYVDNDPMVLVHARALLTSTSKGKTDYLHADVRNPEAILDQAAQTLDFKQPIALMLLGIMNYVIDNTEAHSIVKRLLDALPSGSYLALSHPTAEVHTEAIETAIEQYNASGAAPIRTRSREELTRFFDGLDLLEPGVVSCSLWRPDRSDIGVHTEVTQYGGLARKP
jgi:S-adenosyl methyltransferase